MQNKQGFSTDENLANKHYEPADYKANNQLDKGMAETHEQVSDTYVEGTIDATIENYQGTGENAQIPREGYDQESQKDAE